MKSRLFQKKNIQAIDRYRTNYSYLQRHEHYISNERGTALRETHRIRIRPNIKHPSRHIVPRTEGGDLTRQ